MSNQDHNWQPIETAPKDGTYIVARKPNGDQCGAFYCRYNLGWFDGFGYFTATHWMPWREQQVDSTRIKRRVICPAARAVSAAPKFLP
jgi:hypothetical protein